MKLARSRVRRQAHALPVIRFENHALTSFAGLVLFQKLFAALDLKARPGRRFRGKDRGRAFGPATLFLQMIVHIIMGFRELREAAACRDDPMARRLPGLSRLPDVATLSRMLRDADSQTVQRLRRLLAEMIFQRVAAPGLARLTLDFDGSVQSTRRHAEGTAVGYNKKRKGARSDYPLFCTVAQTHQVLDFLHRSGNVHDSHGAREFILGCVHAVRRALPGIIVEVRMDIHTCQLNDVNSFDYLTQLQRHAEDLAARPEHWMPWNYRETIANSSADTC